ncbi:hypothetical protein HDU98_000420, partial [Podochytrium sp. JEL0797]
MTEDVNMAEAEENVEEEVLEVGAIQEPKTNAVVSETARLAASKASFYDCIPTTAAIHPCQIYSLGLTKNMKWMFTGGEDGFIRKFDFMSSVNGDHSLTAAQRHGLVDSIQKAGAMLSAWEVEEVPLDAPTVALGHDGAPFAFPPTAIAPKISPVFSMQVHSEAQFLLAGCECQYVLRNHEKPVSVLSLSGDERSVMSGSWDRRAIRWDLETGKPARNFTNFNSHITSIKFQPRELSLSDAYFASQPALEELAFVLSFDGKGSVVDHRDPRGAVKSVGTEKGTPPWVDEWDFAEGKLIQNFRLPRDSGPITSVYCMPNGRHVLCGSTDNVRLWDLQYTPPEVGVPAAAATGEGATSTQAANNTSSLHDFDPLHPIVPFSIVAGHHGGSISGMVMDWSCRYLITTSGNRGWDGPSTNLALIYN